MKAIGIATAMVLLMVSCRTSALDMDNLVDSKWGPENEGFGYSIAFGADATYEITSSGQGGFLPVQARGTYEVEGDTVRLAPKEVAVRSLFNKATSLSWRKDDGSLFFTEKLVTTEPAVEFWNHSRPVSEGAERAFAGVRVITLAKRVLVVSENLNMRGGPSLEGSRLHLAQAATESIVPHLPKGWRVRVVGRSEEIVQIGNWTNYWYLVDAMTGEYDRILVEGDFDTPYPTDLVWVFGQFLTQEPNNTGG